MKKLWFVFPCSLFFLAACDWKVFDDFQKQATVQVIEPPRNFVGNNFGQVVAPVLDDAGNVIPNTYLAGGNGTTPLAIVRVNENGTLSRTACTSDIGLPGAALVPLPASGGRWRAILSDGSYQMVYRVSFDPADPALHVQVDANVNDFEPLFGMAAAAGDFNGDGMMDVAVISRSRLYFFNDELNAAQQRTFDYPDRFFVPGGQDAGAHVLVPFVRDGKTLLAIGGMMSDGAGANTWAVLLVGVNPDFTLETQFLQGDFSVPDARVCSLAAGPVDGDAQDDLVVGICSSTQVFLAQSGGSEWFAEQPAMVFEESGKMRGKIVALTDVNQDGKWELAVADPEEPVDAKRNGVVFFYELDGTRKDPLLQLPSPPDEKRFGSSLFSLKTSWMDGRSELVVGGANASYLFFLTGLSGDDDPQLHDPRP